jgi:hypothetical protein
MRTLYRLVAAAGIVAPTLFAGALVLQIGDPAANPEAQQRNAVLIARVTACKSPAETTVTATAEGSENGVRRSIPLKISSLTTAGTFAIARQWPEQGAWVVKLIATNPEYKNYSTGVLVPFEKTTLQWAAIKHFFHSPTDSEVTAMLAGVSDSARSSIN